MARRRPFSDIKTCRNILLRGKTTTQLKIDDFEKMMAAIYEYIGERDFIYDGKRYLLGGEKINLHIMATKIKKSCEDKMEKYKGLRQFKNELITLSKFQHH